jgi:phosphatidylglycerophosphate synthase
MTNHVHVDSAKTTQLTGRRRSHREIVAALKSAQKPSRGTAAYSRHINRPLGRQVAAVGYRIGLTPNGATAISATCSATALVLLAVMPPSLLGGVLVAALLAAGYVFDSVDGQLARLRGGGSLSGELLDHGVDCVKTVCLHLAVLIHLFRYPVFDDDRLLLIPVVFLVVDVLSFFGLVTMPLLRRIHDGGAAKAAGQKTAADEHPLRRWLLLPTDYGIFCWMFVLLGLPVLFLAGYTAMLLVNLAALVMALGKWSRELRVLDRKV